jgi:hypothetical protein
MATTITRAHEVERLAQPIIERHHRHLAPARIIYCFTTAKRTRKGRIVYATAQKLTPLDRYLTADTETSDEGADFLILVGTEEWASLNSAQKKALVDHELCHLVRTEDEEGEGDWAIVGHDLEEFTAVVERHGLVMADTRKMADTMRQLTLEDARVPVGATR